MWAALLASFSKRQRLSLRTGGWKLDEVTGKRITTGHYSIFIKVMCANQSTLQHYLSDQAIDEIRSLRHDRLAEPDHAAPSSRSRLF